MERVRALRRQGYSPKEIARALRMPPAAVAPLVRAIAAEAGADSPAPAPALAGCWVNCDWASGLTVDGHPAWPGLPPAGDSGPAGLVTVVAARERGGSKVSACSYLVDVYCLGVKNAIGPHVLDRRKLPEFRFQMFRSYADPPLEAPLELAQHVVFGAIEYARGLGFEPHPDFEACAGHLGEWQGPSVIGFGYQGKPLFIQGPEDDAARIMKRLNRVQYRRAHMHGNPWLRLLRREVEALAKGRHSDRYVREQQDKAELARVNREIRRLRSELAELEEQRSALSSRLGHPGLDEHGQGGQVHPG